MAVLVVLLGYDLSVAGGFLYERVAGFTSLSFAAMAVGSWGGPMIFGASRRGLSMALIAEALAAGTVGLFGPGTLPVPSVYALVALSGFAGGAVYALGWRCFQDAGVDSPGGAAYAWDSAGGAAGFAAGAFLGTSLGIQATALVVAAVLVSCASVGLLAKPPAKAWNNRAS